MIDPFGAADPFGGDSFGAPSPADESTPLSVAAQIAPLPTTNASEIAESVVTLTVDSPRALPAEELAAVLCERGVKAEASTDDGSAVERAFANAKEKGIPLLMIGSLYMYSQVIDTVNRLLPK